MTGSCATTKWTRQQTKVNVRIDLSRLSNNGLDAGMRAAHHQYEPSGVSMARDSFLQLLGPGASGNQAIRVMPGHFRGLVDRTILAPERRPNFMISGARRCSSASWAGSASSFAIELTRQLGAKNAEAFLGRVDLTFGLRSAHRTIHHMITVAVR